MTTQALRPQPRFPEVDGAQLAVAVGNGGQLGSRHATGVTILAAD